MDIREKNDMNIATNKKTGQQVIYLNNAWVPIEDTASNATGGRAYFAAGKWHTDETSKQREVQNLVENTLGSNTTPKQSLPNRSLLGAISEGISNAPASIGNFIGGAANAILHPIDTTISLGKLAAGGVYKALPDQFYKDYIQNQDTTNALQTANALGQDYKNAYGGYQNVLNTLATDPARLAGDLSMLFTAGAGAAAKVPQGARAAEMLGKAAVYTNPLTPVVSVGGAGINKISKIFPSQANARTKAANIVTASLDKDAAKAKEILANSPPGLSAAQVLAEGGVENRAVYALANELLSKQINSSGYQQLEKQIANDRAIIAKFAGGDSQADALTARKMAKNEVTKASDPYRIAAAERADLGGKLYPPLQEEVAANVQKLKDISTPTSGAGVGTPLTKTPADNEVIDATAKIMAAKGQMNDLAAEGIRPLNVNELADKLSSMTREPGIRADKTQSRILSNLSKQFKGLSEVKGGPTVEDLHQIRKTGVNDVVMKYLKDVDPNPTQARLADLVGTTKTMIDDAIVKAGGDEWIDFLNTHKKGMKDVNRMELSARLLDLYDSSRGEFAKIVNNNNPKEVQDIFGPGVYDIKAAMGDQYSAIKKIADNVLREQKIADMAKNGQGSLTRILNENKDLLQKISGMFNAKVAAYNAATDVLRKRVNAKTTAVLEKAFQSGQDLNKLLEKIPPSEKTNLIKALTYTAPVAKGLYSNAPVLNALSPDRLTPINSFSDDKQDTIGGRNGSNDY